jgi:hypothetical protein
MKHSIFLDPEATLEVIAVTPMGDVIVMCVITHKTRIIWNH